MTVNVLLRKSYKAKDGTYPIVIRVEHGGKQRVISVGYRVKEAFWKAGEVSGRHPSAQLINSAISTKLAEVKKYLADCSLHNKPVHLDLIGTGKQSYSFTEYLEHRAKQYRAQGKPIMWRKVDRFARELRQAFGREVHFDDITADSLRELDRHLINNGNGQNTRHKKFKFLTEFYAHAIDEGKAPAPNPFKKYKINPKPVKKEKLSQAEITAIEDLKLKPGPVNDARNLFLFAFYCHGLRFGNCVLLRRKDINNGRIEIRSSKGNKHLNIKIHSKLQMLIDCYPSKDFVFPFVKAMPEGEEEKIKLIASLNTIANRNLKIIQGLAEIKKKLTFHLSRHAFAYLLMQKTDSIHVIKEALGHSDYRTTEIYLKALDHSVIDAETRKLYGD
jgi:integrase/recombinase XerD